jgi:D-glycero-D-manno-heptose 1,7-bisphosphate phosphatase
MNQKCVFLDRDGVINNNANDYYIYSPERFCLNEGVIEFLKLATDKSYSIIIISNQGGIAKGLYSKEDTDLLHAKLLAETLHAGVSILEFYFCPHHPEVTRCICRKPDSQLLEKAIARFRIDIESSIFMGDSKRDVEAGEKIGLRSIKTQANTNLMQYALYL